VRGNGDQLAKITALIEEGIDVRCLVGPPGSVNGSGASS
jgi:hypothetical protein